MNAPRPAPAWLEARLRAYAQHLSAEPARHDAALTGARAAPDPARALALVRAELLGSAPETVAWTRALLAREGIVTDPARPLAPQRLPIVRAPMAAQPFRRTLARRAITLLARPLARLTRRVQPLGGRVAE